MKKNIISVLSLAFFLAVTSCNFLESEPKDLTQDNYFNTEQEVNSFLGSVYSPLMQEHFYGNAFPLYVNGGDDLSFYQRSVPETSILCGNTNSNDSYVTRFWRTLYEGINRANLLLENLEKAPMSSASREQYRAEARFLRAFYYFNLVQGWGDVPFKTNSTQSPDNLSIPRTDKNQIYDFIISEMEAVIPNLKGASEYKFTGRVTPSAVQGILARVYLFRAGEHFRDSKMDSGKSPEYFAKAKEWALKVKDSGLHSLASDYRQVFVDLCSDQYNSTGARESIWEAEMAGNRGSVEQAAGRVGNTFGFGSTLDLSTDSEFKNETGTANPGYSYMFLFASTKLYELYETEGDKVRGDWNIAPYVFTATTTSPKRIKGKKFYFGKKPADLPTDDGFVYEEGTKSDENNKTRCAAKFRRECETVTPKNKNFTPNNFPILRYSDVLLMLAEAENELNGPTALAKECLNAVRNRAGLNDTDANDQTTFRAAIKRERAMELCFEGIRRYDLIRWGDYLGEMNSMSSRVQWDDAWGKNYKYAADYYKITPAYNYFPIPAAEMALNKDILFNNPGW